jgi:hypothetical protein
MIKQQADARRAVTETDLQLVDKAIQQPADSERMMEIMVKMMEMQSQTLRAVAAAILRDDKEKPKPKPKSKRRGAKAK